MKRNITFSLPEELIRQAKVAGARRGTSVNAMVEESLSKVVAADDQHTAALKRILASAAKSRRSSRKVKWTREELYD